MSTVFHKPGEKPGPDRPALLSIKESRRKVKKTVKKAGLFFRAPPAGGQVDRGGGGMI
jgi:hypothetical protein